MVPLRSGTTLRHHWDGLDYYRPECE
jgi:hypothetical protein